MAAIELRDILNLYEYEKQRDAFRARVIEQKARRRVPVGPNLTLLFENRDTVLYQIQEMVRTERIVDDRKVQDEIDAYAPLLPGPGELSATLFIEIPDLHKRSDDAVRREVNRFQGLDRGAVFLEIGPHRLPARFEGGHSKEEKMAAVQYVRFAVPEDARAVLLDGASPVRLVVRHPNYEADVEVPPETRFELLKDLEG